MKILITGINGFIGKNLKLKAKEEGINNSETVKPSEPNQDQFNLNSGFNREYDKVFNENKKQIRDTNQIDNKNPDNNPYLHSYDM